MSKSFFSLEKQNIYFFRNISYNRHDNSFFTFHAWNNFYLFSYAMSYMRSFIFLEEKNKLWSYAWYRIFKSHASEKKLWLRFSKRNNEGFQRNGFSYGTTSCFPQKYLFSKVSQKNYGARYPHPWVYRTWVRNIFLCDL